MNINSKFKTGFPLDICRTQLQQGSQLKLETPVREVNILKEIVLAWKVAFKIIKRHWREDPF